MNPRYYLRVDGLAVFVAAVATYFALGGPVWMLVVLALAPDLSMLGYLAGSRLGSVTYNVVHSYTLPLAVGGVGLWLGDPLLAQVGAVWAGHVGADRAVGYGLKYPTGFKDTHLSQQPAPVAALVESDNTER